MDRFWIWGILCILVGCGFLANALLIYLRRKKFLATALPAAGTVVEVRVRGIGRNAESVPTFDFQTAEGRTQRSESLMGSGFQGFEVGQEVAVQYDPSDSSRAEVDSFAVMWGLALLRAGYGVLFLIMGTVAVLLTGQP